MKTEKRTRHDCNVIYFNECLMDIIREYGHMSKLSILFRNWFNFIVVDEYKKSRHLEIDSGGLKEYKFNYTM